MISVEIQCSCYKLIYQDCSSTCIWLLKAAPCGFAAKAEAVFFVFLCVDSAAESTDWPHSNGWVRCVFWGCFFCTVLKLVLTSTNFILVSERWCNSCSYQQIEFPPLEPSFKRRFFFSWHCDILLWLNTAYIECDQSISPAELNLCFDDVAPLNVKVVIINHYLNDVKAFIQCERRVDQSDELTEKSRKLLFSDKKLLKSHCPLPAQHHTADRHTFKD